MLEISKYICIKVSKISLDLLKFKEILLLNQMHFFTMLLVMLVECLLAVFLFWMSPKCPLAQFLALSLAGTGH